MVAAAVAGPIAYRILTPSDGVAFGGGVVLGGWIGSRLADVLEPALHGRHRDFFHRIAWGCGSAAWAGSTAVNACVSGSPPLRGGAEYRSMAAMEEADWLPSFIAGLLMGAAAANVMHLFDDGGTPRGLPFLCRSLG